MDQSKAIEEYIDFLTRTIRNSDMSIGQAHQLLMSRMVARELGVTDQELIWLDKNL